MSFYDAIRVGAAGASTGHEVERSIRLNRSDNAKFSKTFSSAGNRKKWTFSVWAKFPDPYDSNTNQIFSYQQGHVNHRGSFYKGSSGVLNYQLRVSGSRKAFVTTDAQLRDPSAWYHIVLVIDSDQGSSTNRVKIYINGVQQSVVYHDTPTSGFETWINSTETLYLGAAADENGGNMYLAEINFIDGQAYDPSYFGETNSLTGQWVPIKYTGAYTGNSFYLKFDDNSNTTATTLGKDSSGLGNNWTPSNFSVSAGAGNDSVEDTPTNNFPTLNPLMAFLNGSSSNAENGNLRWNGVNQNQAGCPASMAFPTSGKWYWEVRLIGSNSNFELGITPATWSQNQNPLSQTGAIGYAAYGSKIVSGSETASWAAGFTSSDVVGVLLDMDNNDIEFYKNNSSVGTISLVSGYENVEYLAIIKGATNSTTISGTINFGQQGFTYTPPTGFKALNSANLPDPTILLPNKHFDTLLYTGNGATSARAITGLDFAPDWIWLKNRAASYHHQGHDTLRGTAGGVLYPNEAQDEDATYSLASFDSNGFSIAKDANQQGQNNNGNGFVAWNWNAGDTDGKTYTVTVVNDSGNKYRFDGFGTSAVTLDLAEGGTYIFNYPSAHPFKFSTTADGTHGGGSEYTTGVTHNSSTQVTIVVAASAPTLYYYCSIHSGMGGQVNTNTTLGSSNFDGSVQSTVKVNATAGFSIIKYAGSGQPRTIGHGLGVKPDVVITKSRDADENWLVWHQHISTSNIGNYAFFLNSNGGPDDASQNWYDTVPTSTVFTRGNYSSGDNMIAYCFSGVSGYSKFGKYIGNGVANGTFVYTGFRVALLITKRIQTRNWIIYDNKRGPFNEVDNFLEADTNNAEDPKDMIDFTANGFKLRDSDTDVNSSGDTYIYLAFAESPFKNSRAR